MLFHWQLEQVKSFAVYYLQLLLQQAAECWTQLTEVSVKTQAHQILQRLPSVCQFCKDRKSYMNAALGTQLLSLPKTLQRQWNQG